jgi:two-component system phosphate regulon sensor histidine kinase PhoR
LAITLLAMVAVGWLSARSMRSFYLNHTQQDLELRARLLLSELPATFPATSPDSLQQFCATRKLVASARITLVAKDGHVLGDSDADPNHMENHGSHPEVKAAIGGIPTFDVRHSITVHQTLMYFALPVRQDSAIVGVLRTAVPLTTFAAALRTLIWRIVLGGILVAVLAAIITLVLSRRVNRPMIEMMRGAERYAHGDFTTRIELPDSVELASLADAVNHMAAELDTKIRELTTQRNEQQAMLASMREGVIAVDSAERILFMNGMAGTFLETDVERVKGRLLQECVRNSHLQRFVRRMLMENEIPPPEEISLAARDQQVLQINGSYLRDAAGQQFGALVVLNNITRLRQLEGMRKEFVANVSHELRTPIATIRGFVETLRDGAWDDPEHARAFLERIAQNVERLNALVDDLLSLSRIETETDRPGIERVRGDVLAIVRSAVEVCGQLAEERQIEIVVISEGNTSAMVNPTLLEQAVVNLLDNALKYTEPGQQVTAELKGDANQIVVRVRDTGCGISAEHLPRLFERFYRVDKARSRKLGGTGLGLAIVKHIVQAHGGMVTAESTVGRGSTFTIILPAAGEA